MDLCFLLTTFNYELWIIHYELLYLCIMNLNDKRIAVLLSGGVDSSVVLYELVRQGLKPDCFYIKIGPDEKDEWDCSMEEDLEMATAVSHKYGCKLEVIDCHQEYWNQVTTYTINKVRAGLQAIMLRRRENPPTTPV